MIQAHALAATIVTLRLSTEAAEVFFFANHAPTGIESLLDVHLSFSIPSSSLAGVLFLCLKPLSAINNAS